MLFLRLSLCRRALYFCQNGGINLKKLSYREKFRQMNREAIATCAITVLLIAFWWFGAFGIDSSLTFLSMPLWFFISCIGTYILAILLVWLITKKVFVDFDLEDDENKEKIKEYLKNL